MKDTSQKQPIKHHSIIKQQTTKKNQSIEYFDNKRIMKGRSLATALLSPPTATASSTSENR
jgi:hypothetical protein